MELKIIWSSLPAIEPYQNAHNEERAKSVNEVSNHQKHGRILWAQDDK